MKSTKVAVLVLLFASVIVSAASARADQPRDTAIRELLEVTGSTDLAKQVMDQMMPGIWKLVQKANPEIPDELLSAMDNELKRTVDETMPEFTKGVAAIYTEHFTDAEIAGLLAFYKTSLGQKVIRILPQITTQLMTYGRHWGQKVLAPLVIERVTERLRKEGYEL